MRINFGGKMETPLKGRNIKVDTAVLTQIIERVDEMESLVETLEVGLDRGLLRQIEQSRRDFAAGKSRFARTKQELDAYLTSLG